MTPKHVVRTTPYKTVKWIDKHFPHEQIKPLTKEEFEKRRMVVEMETALRVAEAKELNGNGVSK